MLQESESNKSKHCKRHPFPILPHLSSRLGGLGFSLSVLGGLVRFAFFCDRLQFAGGFTAHLVCFSLCHSSVLKRLSLSISWDIR